MSTLKKKYSNLLNNFNANLVLRIIFLSAAIFLFSFSYAMNYSIAVSILILAAIILQIYYLIKYVNITNRKLSAFLLAIKYSDFTRIISFGELGSSFQELEEAFNGILNRFNQLRNEKEEHAKFLQTVIHHIGLGLISYQQGGKVELINNAAKKLLKINSLVNIHSLEVTNKPVFEKLLTIKAGDKVFVKYADNNELSQLLLYATEFKRQDKMYMLVSIQNIQKELDEKEMEAWQKLISVLTHEIMNSITPISSLAQTIESLLRNDQLDKESLNDIKSGARIIHKRSEGLIDFVNNYRTLTKIPVPDFSIIRIEELFDTIHKLLENKISQKNIRFNYVVEPESLELTGDHKLIEQVLINLILNSIDAANNNRTPVVELKAIMGEKGQLLIQVKDNGDGILDDVQDKIFIPFFTTKENGSGIGLSLARQIMRQHGGNITVFSRPNECTIFTLIFNS